MARHVARVRERRNAYSILVWKREGISQRWENSVKKSRKEHVQNEIAWNMWW